MNKTVTIIIPTKSEYLAQNCISDILLNTRYIDRYDIIVMVNGLYNFSAISKFYMLTDTINGNINCGVKNSTNIHIIDILRPIFNYSEINNLGAEMSRSKYILFLNDDISIIKDTWLRDMISIIEKEDNIGAVGCKLMYPGGSIQHAGVRLIESGIAENITDENGDRPKEVVAVTGACMLVKKIFFDAIGGFDENLFVDYGDVDLCLRFKKSGYKVMYAPDIILIHKESETRKVITDRGRVLHDYDLMASKLGKKGFLNVV